MSRHSLARVFAVLLLTVLAITAVPRPALADGPPGSHVQGDFFVGGFITSDAGPGDYFLLFYPDGQCQDLFGAIGQIISGRQPYQLTEAHRGRYLRVQDVDFTPLGSCAGPIGDQVVSLPFDVGVQASIGGAVEVGNPLTAQVDPSVSPTPSALAYEWQVDGLTASTAAAYTPEPDDAGKSLVLRVTATAEGYDDSVDETDPVTVSGASVVAVQLTGSTAVGKVLRASLSPALAGATVSWQWWRGSTKLAGSADRSYELAPDDLGSRVRVVATVTRPGYATATAHATSGVVRLQPLKLSVTPLRFRAGAQLELTLRNLLPGESWEVSLGNAEWAVTGRAASGSKTVNRTVRIPQSLKFYGDRYLVARTPSSDRQDWVQVNIRA